MLERLEQSGLFDRAGAIAHGLRHGRHAAASPGRSAEFFDFRPYEPGDPPARVDWRLFGRTDRLFIRRRRHESQQSLRLVVDASASMHFAAIEPASAEPTKLRVALEVAAALALVTVRRGDRAALTPLHPADPATAPAADLPGLHRIIAALERAEHGDENSAGLAPGLAACTALGRGGAVTIITDGLDDTALLADPLARLAFGPPKAAITVIQILTPDELHPPSLSGRFTDPEHGVTVTTNTDDVSDRYAELLSAQIDSLRNLVRRLGGRHHLVRTTDDPVQIVRAALG